MAGVRVGSKWPEELQVGPGRCCVFFFLLGWGWGCFVFLVWFMFMSAPKLGGLFGLGCGLCLVGLPAFGNSQTLGRKFVLFLCLGLRSTFNLKAF